MNKPATSKPTNLLLPAICLVFLSACTGTGSTSKSEFYSLVDSNKTAVLVVRNTGYAGSAALVDVRIDGVSIGTLGEKEVLTKELSAGSHRVAVKFKGLGGVGLNDVAKVFTLEVGEKAFYSIQLETGFLTNKLKLVGLTKDSFFE
jgi:hypothetical protein